MLKFLTKSSKGQTKMGILSWLSKRYFGERSYEDAGFHKSDFIHDKDYDVDSCIGGCKYAVLDTRKNYICFIKKHELRYNSVIQGCIHYASKGEISGKLLCPNCKSDLIERTPDHRFKCAGCGRIFS
jgi:hypothetical protein